jgi:hypothetical protein
MEYNNCKIATSLVNNEAPIKLAVCFRVIDPFNGDEHDYKNTRSRTVVSLYTPSCTMKMPSYHIPSTYTNQPEYLKNNGSIPKWSYTTALRALRKALKAVV